MLNFLDDFIFIGFAIALLLICPLIIFLLKSNEVEKHRNVLRYYPAGTRLVFIIIFLKMAILVHEKQQTCQKYLEDMKFFRQTNECMDDYSQVDVRTVSTELQELDTKLTMLRLAFIIISVVAGIELAVLFYIKFGSSL